MISTKGFLSPGPDRRPRMTAKHKAAILKAVRAALDHWMESAELGQITAALRESTSSVIEAAMLRYPTDRSCHTCDFFSTARMCLHWKQEVPADAVEAGCDHHQQHGAPY